MAGLLASTVNAASNESEPSWRAVIEGRDWGPAVTKLVVGPQDPVAVPNGNPSLWTVRARRDDMAAFVPVSITGFYPSGASGDLEPSGRYLALELAYGHDRSETIPMIYESSTRFNRFADIRFQVTLPEGTVIETESSLGPRWLTVEEFDLNGSFTHSDPEYGEIALTSAFRTSTGRGRSEGEKRPLLIWLHGAGEGGTDPRIALLGNRAVNLASAPFQHFFGGADILVPQCPSFWMDSGRGAYTLTGSSKYARSLMALIESHFASRPETDLSRVYLGGCSNGGFMTVKLIADNPGVFAAGWPVCEAYVVAWLNDAQAASLAATPLWFTHAKNDRVVPPALTTVPTVEKLRKMNARDVRLSLFPEVIGSDGESYIGHFSWVYALKNECADDTGLTLMEWLARQRL